MNVHCNNIQMYRTVIKEAETVPKTIVEISQGATKKPSEESTSNCPCLLIE